VITPIWELSLKASKTKIFQIFVFQKSDNSHKELSLKASKTKIFQIFVFQNERGVSKTSLEEILKEQNYCEKIIQSLLYPDTPYTIKNIKLTGQETQINDDPLVFTINNFLTDEECDHMINLAQPHFQRALVSSDNGGIISAGRTGENYWINHTADEITATIAIKIASLLNIPLENAENFQMIYYGIFEEYQSHFDGWEYDDSAKSITNLLRGGQRLWTALCYLNNVKQGGGTRFTLLDKEISAENC
jgi:hypothetical protein